MKKKILAIATLVLVLVLAFSIMVACSDKGNGNQNGEIGESQESDGEQNGNEQGAEQGGNEQSGGEQGGEDEEKPITSEVGLKYKHTGTTITYASEEAKATMLDETECTEEEFFNVYDKTMLDVQFFAENKATIAYIMGGNGEVLNLYYQAEGGIVSFYDTEEDMQNGNVKTDRGVFSGRFKLSEDYKTLQWIADMPNMCNVTLDCTLAK